MKEKQNFDDKWFWQQKFEFGPWAKTALVYKFPAPAQYQYIMHYSLFD